MRFEVSERIQTRRSAVVIVNALEVQLRKIARVTRRGEVITARAVESSFGAINRHDLSVFTVKPVEDGVLCVAEVVYRPSIAFWIFFALGLFAYGLLFWIPIVFYLGQKKTVRSAIKDVFARVKNEFGIEGKSFSSDIQSLAILSDLKEKGILSDSEFERGKSQILGAGTVPPLLPQSGGFCNRCGSLLQLGSRFCASCGATSEPRNLPEPIVAEGGIFGAEAIEPGNSTSGQAPTGKVKHRTRNFLWPVAIVLVMIGLIVIAPKLRRDQSGTSRKLRDAGLPPDFCRQFPNNPICGGHESSGVRATPPDYGSQVSDGPKLTSSSPHFTDSEPAEKASFEDRIHSDPKAFLLQSIWIDFTWRKEAFGTAMTANFTVHNPTQFSFKDFEITCTHSGPSGTVIDSNVRTIYEMVEAQSVKRVPDVDMGFINTQVVQSACKVTNLAFLQ